MGDNVCEKAEKVFAMRIVETWAQAIGFKKRERYSRKTTLLGQLDVVDSGHFSRSRTRLERRSGLPETSLFPFFDFTLIASVMRI